MPASPRRTLSRIAVGLAFVAGAAEGQSAAVSGQILLKEGGQPLGYTTVSVLSEGRQFLTNESGKFLLPGLAEGEVRLRFKRIGFHPRDTTLRLGATDTIQLRIEMERLVIQLPAMLVAGKCTNESPTQPQPRILADLFEQVRQNAERARLLASQRPFVLLVYRVQGIQRGGRIQPTVADTAKKALEYLPYQPTKIVDRDSSGSLVFHLPDLANLADSAFVSTHCFTYAGQGRWESDSVIKIDYEPVPWLDKETDIRGTMYLRATDYQLVGTLTKLNRIPPALWRSQLQELTVNAKFREIVSGIPTLDEWVMTRRFRTNTRLELGQVFRLEWLDSAKVKKP